MIEIADGDDDLEGLLGLSAPSPRDPAVRYHLDRRLGAGACAVTFLARRASPDGESLVALKVVRPGLVVAEASMADLVFRKETVALGRLGDRVPPTPFVVRLFEAGAWPARALGVETRLPWLAVEYVHGGVDGTTLEERVAASVAEGGFGFGAERAAHAIACVAEGLAAAHEVEVIHRDLTPRNVLCAGSGAGETFKIADFGLARPIGVKQTFEGSGGAGTPGFAAPEQFGHAGGVIGPHTDVFGLGGLLYYVLTGEPLFQGPGFFARVVAPLSPERRSLAASERLSPDLRDPTIVAALDGVIARATAAERGARHASSRELAAEVSAALGPRSRSARSTRGSGRSSAARRAVAERWTARVVRRPLAGRVILSVAWDGAGGCLAATTGGAAFWDGTFWRDADLGTRDELVAVHHAGPDAWIAATAAGELLALERGRVAARIAGPPGIAGRELAHVDGDPRDFAIAVSEARGTPPRVHVASAGRWHGAIALAEPGFVTALARLDDARWLLALRGAAGGSAVVAHALVGTIASVALPPARAVLGAAARAEGGDALLAGTAGLACRVDLAGRATPVAVPDGADLASAALDPFDGAWAGAAGALYRRPAGGEWARVAVPAAVPAPIVALFADAARVVGIAADGGVVEATPA